MAERVGADDPGQAEGLDRPQPEDKIAGPIPGLARPDIDGNRVEPV